jgi:predicted unusual protein kinase regulating ubiquinone biosynthesis (AarF/ABC1/UbiB family)
MNQLGLRARHLRILLFAGRIAASIIFWDTILARIGFRGYVRHHRRERLRSYAVRFRVMAIRMGGVMIKVGQFLSSRLDVLPPEITDELSGLQDEVPAEPFSGIRALAEQELGAPLEERFEWFDPTPLAAASLGQVHRARLRSSPRGATGVPAPNTVEASEVEEPALGRGESEGPSAEPLRDVVFKVQRPHIDQIVEVDLSALKTVGRWLMRYRAVREHADVPELLREFAATVRQEIDYINEGKNAETFARNFASDPKVHVPRVVWSHTTLRMLTLEDVYAIKITDYSSITAAGIDRAEVAGRLLDTYLRQIFEHGFFHADPHPGNLFVTPGNDGHWRLTFVDFGMTGVVPPQYRAGLRDIVIGIATRDAARVVHAYQLLDALLPTADVNKLEQAEAQLFDAFWGLSMSELRKIRPEQMRKFGHQFREMMVTMPFQVPNNLLMLLRTVGILSGMCTGLDPGFNLWNQLAPYARQLVEEEAKTGWRDYLDQLLDALQALVALPGQSSRVFARLEAGELTVQTPDVTRQMVRLARAMDRLTAGLLFTALLFGGILLYNAGHTTLGGVLFVSSALMLLGMLFSRRD